jgi:hypothetical protein
MSDRETRTPADAGHQRIAQELQRLRELETYDLQVRWRRVFGRSAPRHLPKHLLLRILAYKLQADAFGDLDRGTVRLLEQIARDTAKAKTKGDGLSKVVPPVEETRGLKPGTLLVREHEGVLHRVTVQAKGFAWNGQSFRSLSEVARAITGTRWNGPRFFGLRQGGTTAQSKRALEVRL